MEQQCSLCRPGGMGLTDRLYQWIPEDISVRKVLDLGCGSGTSLILLKAKHPETEFYGVDPDLQTEQIQSAEKAGVHLIRGGGENIPLESDSMDVLMMECSFSRMRQPQMVLEEIRRVLHKDGILLISDLYLRGSKQAVDFGGTEGIDCSIGRIESADSIQQMLQNAGFHIFQMEDVSKVLGDWVAQMIMDGNGCEIPKMLGVEPFELKRIRPGYYLLAAEPSQIPDLVDYVRKNSPFYWKMYGSLGAEKFNEWEYLRSLPTIDSEILREDPESLLCTSPREIARIITLNSSGSSGRPKRIFFTEEDLDATADFFSEGIRWLVRPGDRVAVYMEGPTHYSVAGLLKAGLARLPAEVCVCGLIRDYEVAAEQAEGMDSYIGVPAQMYRLARLHPELRPRTILLSADNVPNAVKHFLETTWKCQVFTHWGMSETGYGGGVQCTGREGYHLRNRHLVIEVVDPDTLMPVNDGEVGELILTTVHRKGMPLIRYRTGDLASMITGPCSCGCLLPRLAPIKGRLKGGIPLPDGSQLRLPELDELIYPLPILGYQARWQEETRTLGLHLLAVDEANEKEELTAKLERQIREQFGASFTVQVDWEYNKEDKGMQKRRMYEGDPY